MTVYKNLGRLWRCRNHYCWSQRYLRRWHGYRRRSRWFYSERDRACWDRSVTRIIYCRRWRRSGRFTIDMSRRRGYRGGRCLRTAWHLRWLATFFFVFTIWLWWTWHLRWFATFFFVFTIWLWWTALHLRWFATFFFVFTIWLWWTL